MPEKGNCRSCGRPVLWVRSGVTGCLLPLDAEPDEGGNVVLADGLAYTLTGDLFEPQLEGPRYFNHMANCVANAKRKEKKP